MNEKYLKQKEKEEKNRQEFKHNFKEKLNQNMMKGNQM